MLLLWNLGAISQDYATYHFWTYVLFSQNFEASLLEIRGYFLRPLLFQKRLYSKDFQDIVLWDSSGLNITDYYPWGYMYTFSEYWN